jgi:hypothetical protein
MERYVLQYTSIALLLITVTASACRPSLANLKSLNKTSATMRLSDNKQYLLKMTPSRWGKKGSVFIKKQDSIGTVFKLNPKGELHYQWNSKEVFPSEISISSATLSSKYYEILISNKGDYIIKVQLYGKHLDDSFKKRKDFIQILHNGKVKNKYSYNEFVKKETVAYSSCLGTLWLKKESIRLDHDTLYFELTNGEKFKVNIISGEKAFLSENNL